MAADLEAVAARADVVGVVDHPGRKPADFAFERGEEFDFSRGARHGSLQALCRFGKSSPGAVVRDAEASLKMAIKRCLMPIILF